MTVNHLKIALPSSVSWCSALSSLTSLASIDKGMALNAREQSVWNSWNIIGALF